MVTIVCLINLLLALINLFIAWRLWKLRRLLANVARSLTRVEGGIHFVLDPAPEVIGIAQGGTHNLRSRYQKLELQLQQVQQFLTLIGLGLGLWQRLVGKQIRRQKLRKQPRLKVKKR